MNRHGRDKHKLPIVTESTPETRREYFRRQQEIQHSLDRRRRLRLYLILATLAIVVGALIMEYGQYLHYHH